MLALATVLAAGAAHAAHERDWSLTPLDDESPEFDFDGPPETRHHLFGHVTWGADLEVQSEHQNNFDLDDDDADDVSRLTPIASVAASWDPDNSTRGFVELEWSRRFEDRAEKERDQDTSLEVKQAWLLLRDVLPGLSVQLGRQSFEDEREWLYDEELDGARVFWRRGQVAVEASLTREELAARDFLRERSREKIDNWHARLRWRPDDDFEHEAYVLYRDDRDESEADLTWVGVRSVGELLDDLEYWVEAAAVRGADGRRDVRGHGFDTGATWAFEDVAMEPSVTLAFARGSGDRNRRDGVDRDFRQTGLQDNTARFNGVTSFAYYGETLDPELSNLNVFTIGVGVRPTPDASVDLVWHRYWQEQADDDFRDVAIDEEPDGDLRGIGQALDLVVGYRGANDVDMELVLGAFWPGRGFDPDADRALFLGYEVKVDF